MPLPCSIEECDENGFPKSLTQQSQSAELYELSIAASVAQMKVDDARRKEEFGDNAVMVFLGAAILALAWVLFWREMGRRKDDPGRQSRIDKEKADRLREKANRLDPH